jgi:Zn-finger nucleic acid-binding protein
MKMTTSSLAEVEIDVCPDCRGIYLDAGELDKLLEEGRRSRILSTIAAVRRFLVS